MTYIVIPAHLWPATALEFHRIVYAIPEGLRCRITALDAEGVTWEVLP